MPTGETVNGVGPTFVCPTRIIPDTFSATTPSVIEEVFNLIRLYNYAWTLTSWRHGESMSHITYTCAMLCSVLLCFGYTCMWSEDFRKWGPT